MYVCVVGVGVVTYRVLLNRPSQGGHVCMYVCVVGVGVVTYRVLLERV